MSDQISGGMTMVYHRRMWVLAIFLALVTFPALAKPQKERATPLEVGTWVTVPGTGKAGEMANIPWRRVAIMIPETPASQDRQFSAMFLDVEGIDLKSPEGHKYHIVGNLQIYEGVGIDAKPIGDFENYKILVRIPYPSEQRDRPWVLYFWVTRGNPENKEWVSLKGLESDAGYGVIAKVKDVEKNAAGKPVAAITEVTKWPVNDIIISWDG